jgi:hypothetical protein
MRTTTPITDAEGLHEIICSQPMTDELISQVSQIALQDIFGYEFNVSDTNHLRWLYGLLSILEKPLLPDTAADLLDLGRVIKASRTDNSIETDILLCLIERYFNQKSNH